MPIVRWDRKMVSPWNDAPSRRRHWAAAGSVDTDLSFWSLLKLYGTEVAERQVPTRLVKDLLVSVAPKFCRFALAKSTT